MRRSGLLRSTKRAFHPRSQVFQPKHRGTTHHHHHQHQHNGTKHQQQTLSEKNIERHHGTTKKPAEPATSYSFYPVQTAAKLVAIFDAVNTNMEMEVAKIQYDYEEYVTRRGTEAVSMDRIVLGSEIDCLKQLKLVAGTITEAMGYTIEAFYDALIRADSGSLAGSGENNELTADEIDQITRHSETLCHLRQQVTGSTVGSGVTPASATRVSFFESVRINILVTVWMLTAGTREEFLKFAAYMAADEALDKCEILRRGGLSVPSDLLEAADEEALENGKAIYAAFEAKVAEELDQRDIDEMEMNIALAAYAGTAEFQAALQQLVSAVLGQANIV
ncbi:hypothetical protein Poli38472_004676 [Pythium oligandrum]|uniref:Uncharacterized protein n=1 Tax=Pythium oligandrum TaxID=41045 RepID=A0A8K1CC28_PYTOL|nr:hypothetical protein Poli38472_004676 [Pythium oligandrum]|eukprot:TMW59607.1 hypothetical protein Poli38472_004676 [Pythium oligandrum]